MAYHHNQSGNGAQPPFVFRTHQQRGGGANGQRNGRGDRRGQFQGHGRGMGQMYGNGGLGQQFGNGAFGYHHSNNFNRQPQGNLENGEQYGAYGFQLQQPQTTGNGINGLNGVNYLHGVAPVVNEQQPAAQGFITQMPIRNGTALPKHGAPNPEARPFVPPSELLKIKVKSVVLPVEQRPQVKVLHGDPNLANRPGFWKALDGEQLLETIKKQQLPLPDCLSSTERFRREAEAECMTPESVDRFWAGENRKLQNQQNQNATPQQTSYPTQTPITIAIDLQKGLGKVRTGKAVYAVVGIIQDQGDEIRMSNGIFTIQHPSGGFRVAKFVKVETPGQIERARAERDVLLRLKNSYSPHINFMYECHWPNGDDHCIFILDHCDGGSIEGAMMQQQRQNTRFSEGFLWHVLHHMSSALALCHYGIRDPLLKKYQSKTWSCIAHLDIKPGNVFFSRSGGKGLEDDEFPTIILGDFGCAVTADDLHTGKFEKNVQPFGTPAWYPPEGRAGAKGKHAGRYGKSTDIWQLGALIVCMARLNYIPDFEKLYGAAPCGPGYSSQLNQMVKWCLDHDIAKRPSAVDIAERMKEWKKIVVEGQESG